MNKVFSFKDGIEAGFNPKFYKFGKDLPLGEFTVTLDFKLWGKGSTAAVACYCTNLHIGELFMFNVFRNKNGDYLLRNTELDLVVMPYGTTFEIKIMLNSKGNRVVIGNSE